MEFKWRAFAYWLCGVILWQSQSFAADADDTIRGVDDQPHYVGALLGLNFPKVSESGVSTVGALTLGTRVNSSFGLGLFASYHGLKSSGPYFGLPDQASVSATLVTGQGNIFFGGLHAGIEAGGIVWSWSGASTLFSGGSSTASFLLGANAGYDYRFSRNISIGAEVHFFLPTQISDESFVQVFAVSKIWF